MRASTKRWFGYLLLAIFVAGLIVSAISYNLQGFLSRGHDLLLTLYLYLFVYLSDRKNFSRSVVIFSSIIGILATTYGVVYWWNTWDEALILPAFLAMTASSLTLLRDLRRSQEVALE